MSAVQAQISIQDRAFRDENGREVLLHGVNMVYKVPPYIPASEYDPERSVTDQEIQDLKSWGVNFVRLGVLWEAAETAPNEWDDFYLDSLFSLSVKLGQAGIYTLIDGHQDAFSTQFCGEGFPTFYSE